MDGLLIVVVLSLVLVGALFLISRLSALLAHRRPEATQQSDPEPENNHPESKDWRSLKIAPGTERCEYASIMSGKVFLIGEAPPLPLVNCHQSSCFCRYIYLDDRRSGIDRRIDLDDPNHDVAPGQDYWRRRGGRRATDLVA